MEEKLSAYQYNLPAYRRSRLQRFANRILFRYLICCTVGLIFFMTVSQIFLTIYTEKIGHDWIYNSTETIGSVYNKGTEEHYIVDRYNKFKNLKGDKKIKSLKELYNKKLASTGDDYGENIVISYTDKSVKELKDNYEDLAQNDINTDIDATHQKTMYLIIGLMSILVFLPVMFYESQNHGIQDINLATFERFDLNKKWGFYAGALAELPAIILYILAVVSYFTGKLNFAIRLFRICLSPFSGFLCLITNSTSIAKFSVSELVFFGLFLLILPAVVGASYILGIARKDPFYKAMYKKKIAEHEGDK